MKVQPFAFRHDYLKICLVVLIAVFTLFLSPLDTSATTTESNVSDAPNTELSQVIQKNVRVRQNNNGTAEVYIVNATQVREKLLEEGYSYVQLDNTLDQINSYLKENNVHLRNASMFRKAGTCSKALQFIGYVHAGSYAAAAAMLGVTGPAAVIVPLLVGLVYQAGSLFC